MSVHKLFRRLKILWSYYKVTAVERALRASYIRRRTSGKAAADAPVIALQCVEDLLYFGTYAEIICELRRSLPVVAEQYVFRSLRHGENSSFRSYIFTRMAVNLVSDRRWIRLYNSFCDGVAVRSATWLSPWTEWKIWWQARKIRRSFRSKEEFGRLEIRGILIGDLVIDSFIRFAPSPEFDIHNSYASRVLRQALRDLEKAFRYFQGRQPQMFLTSYTSYVQHGIPARVALACGVKVLAFGNYQQMSKPLDPDDDTHLAEHWRYAERFAALSPAEQQKLLALADRKLADRMCGEVDSAIGYMSNSPYVATNQNLPPVQGAAIIYLPDFYDSIHVYRWSVFEDYWDWICCTIDTLQQAGTPFFIKGHPNASEESLAVYERIRIRYPDAPFLESGITSAQLAAAGIACGISPRGTVLSELSYLGVPVVAGGDHPHADFDLQSPARSREDYVARLANPHALPRDPAAMRRRACAFYAMHNLPANPEETELRDAWLAIRALTRQSIPEDAADMIQRFDALGNLPHFRALVAEWTNLLSPSPPLRVSREAA